MILRFLRRLLVHMVFHLSGFKHCALLPVCQRQPKGY